jgi:signal peptidase I
MSQDYPSHQPSFPRPTINRFALIRELVGTVIFFVSVFTLLQLTIPRSVVYGKSMEPTFEEGQYLVINRLNYLFGEPHRGDVVVFNAPGNSSDDPSLIKRVIGLPGEVIEMIDAEFYIDGILLDEPYIKIPCNAYRCSNNQRWEMGEDEYFLVGDNRSVSNDSRAFGAVPRNRIIGQALFRYWPLENMGFITTP